VCEAAKVLTRTVEPLMIMMRVYDKFSGSTDSKIHNENQYLTLDENDLDVPRITHIGGEIMRAFRTRNFESRRRNEFTS
jgi:hypothetical protein